MTIAATSNRLRRSVSQRGSCRASPPWSGRASRVSGEWRECSTTPVSSFPGNGRNSPGDRKSTRLNSSHQITSYAVFCLKKKKIQPVLDLHKVQIAELVLDEVLEGDVGLVDLDVLDFFFNDTATTEIYTLSLHDALPI